MKFTTPNCPICHEQAEGTVESIQGIALIDRAEDGSFEYAGKTRVCWFSQQTLTDDHGRTQLTCGNHHDWFSFIEDEEPID